LNCKQELNINVDQPAENHRAKHYLSLKVNTLQLIDYSLLVISDSARPINTVKPAVSFSIRRIASAVTGDN